MKEETGFQDIELKLLDQASFASVRAFVDTLDKELDRLDILVENAAVCSQEKAFLTEDGWESWSFFSTLLSAVIQSNEPDEMAACKLTTSLPNSWRSSYYPR
jgi:NAD(P)-dependent dehydrogenase (short-subunit alcohol dehydrogenase family)